MKRAGLVAGLTLLAAPAATMADPPAPPVGPPMLGFAPARTGAERAAETAFDASLDPKDIAARLQRMSSAPNQVGSPHDRANAEFVLGEFRRWGWDAHIETFQALYPTPIAETLELIGPTPFKATLN